MANHRKKISALIILLTCSILFAGEKTALGELRDIKPARVHLKNQFDDADLDETLDLINRQVENYSTIRKKRIDATKYGMVWFYSCHVNIIDLPPFAKFTNTIIGENGMDLVNYGADGFGVRVNDVLTGTHGGHIVHQLGRFKTEEQAIVVYNGLLRLRKIGFLNRMNLTGDLFFNFDKTLALKYYQEGINKISNNVTLTEEKRMNCNEPNVIKQNTFTTEGNDLYYLLFYYDQPGGDFVKAIKENTNYFTAYKDKYIFNLKDIQSIDIVQNNGDADANRVCPIGKAVIYLKHADAKWDHFTRYNNQHYKDTREYNTKAVGDMNTITMYYDNPTAGTGRKLAELLQEIGMASKELF